MKSVGRSRDRALPPLGSSGSLWAASSHSIHIEMKAGHLCLLIYILEECESSELPSLWGGGWGRENTSTGQQLPGQGRGNASHPIIGRCSPSVRCGSGAACRPAAGLRRRWSGTTGLTSRMLTRAQRMRGWWDTCRPGGNAHELTYSRHLVHILQGG